MTLFRQFGDRIGEAWTHTSLGSAYVSLNRIAEGTDHHRQATTIFSEIGDRQGEAWGTTASQKQPMPPATPPTRSPTTARP
jgi:hypothetical protein